MTRSRSALLTLALVMVMLLSAGATGTAGATTSGNDTTAEQTFVVQQGDACYEPTPLGDGTQSVESFYNYSADFDWSSEGTRHLQENQVSNLFIYHGSEGYSLVFLHDKHGDGPHGSTTTMTVAGQTENGTWAVEDDDYQGRDDNFDHYGTYSEIDWMWAPDRTDGAAYRGLAVDDATITVDPAFNEEAEAWNSWPYAGDADNRTEAWKLLQEDGVTVTELEMTENVTVATGACEQGLTASVSANQTAVTTGESVTFDASASTGDEEIVEYRWDVDGDGEVDETTTSPTTSHAYANEGEYDATVTVVDASGNEDTAAVTITVTADDGDDGDTTPPTAKLHAPSEADVGADVTLDASDSTDDTGIVEYHWDVDGDGEVEKTTSEATYTTSYDAKGDYDATVTVADAAGNTDTANATITVTKADDGDEGDTTSPTAKLDVQEKTTVGTTVALDASASSDDTGIVQYKWDVDGDGEVDETTEKSVLKTSYDAAGEYEPTVTAVDEAGNTDTAMATITVIEEDTEDPMAKVDAPSATTAGTEITFDASASTDNVKIAAYHWDFDSDGTPEKKTSDPTVKTSYDAAGEYDAEVTVIDTSGNKDVASTTVNVSEADTEAPTVSVDVPEKVTVGEEFTATVTDISDESGIDHVCWYVNGEVGPDGKTLTHTFTETGTHTVSVLVRDEAGNERKVTRDVTVVSDDAKDGSDGSDDSDSDDSKDDTDDSKDHDDSNDSDDSDDHDSSDSSSDSSDSDSSNVSVTDVHVDDETVEAGDAVSLTVTVENDGGAAGTYNASLAVGDESDVVDTANATVDAGEERTLTLSTSFDEPGEYTVHVANHTVDVTVTDADTPTETPDEDAADDEAADDTSDSSADAETETEADDDNAGGGEAPENADSTGATGPGFGIAAVVVATLTGVAARYWTK